MHNTNIVPIDSGNRRNHDNDHVLGIDIRGTVTETHLDLHDDLSFDDWAEIGRKLQAAHCSLLWCIGDWLNYGERKYGEKYDQALQLTGYQKKTLRNAAFVCRHIEMSRRRDTLTFSHHAEVASLSVELQEELLSDAAHNRHTREQIREGVKRIKSLNMTAARAAAAVAAPVKPAKLSKQGRIKRIRKLSTRGHDSTQIAKEIDITPEHTRKLAKDNGIKIQADAVMRGARKIDHVRVFEQTVTSLESVFSAALIDGSLEKLNDSQIEPDWLPRLQQSKNDICRLIRKLKSGQTS